MSTAIFVGNPKPKSRTLEAASLVAEKLTGAPPEVVIEVIDIAPALLGWGDPPSNRSHREGACLQGRDLRLADLQSNLHRSA